MSFLSTEADDIQYGHTPLKRACGESDDHLWASLRLLTLELFLRDGSYKSHEDGSWTDRRLQGEHLRKLCDERVKWRKR